ncbi:MAG: helix-turn-helix domain-containing protein, partial [Clostridia bacterium]|nr:helix-turn-helix domain-containing protein [Clostridia bacterium]
NWIGRFNKLDEVCSQDDLVTAKAMLEIAHKTLPERSYGLMMSDIDKAKKTIQSRTAWRIEGTLREYPRFAPVNLWFDYPIHRIDDVGVLQDCGFEGDFNTRNSPYKKNFEKKKTKEELKAERQSSLENAFECGTQNEMGEVNISEICEYTGKSDDTIRRWLKEFSNVFYVSNSKVGKKTATAKSN